METAEYEFTTDWFHWAPEIWTRLIDFIPERKAFLEIGSYEGRSSVWMVEHLMVDGGWIDCVDTWTGGEEHTAQDMAAVEARFDRNMDTLREKYFADGHPANRRKVYKHKGTSLRTLSRLLMQQQGVPRYDFIYVDGSHLARDVLSDACLAMPLLKPGGLMVFDDYLWGEARDILHRPKLAVDAFININVELLDVVYTGYQAAVRKKEGVL